MKITSKKLLKFQEGGAMPTDAGAPVELAPAQGGDPMMLLAEVFMQGLLNQDCEMLALGALMFLEIIQLAAGGGAPAEEQGQPVFRRGGKLAYRKK